jgi:hypothetical protein
MNTIDEMYPAPLFGTRIYRAGDDKLGDFLPAPSERVILDQTLEYGEEW